MSVITSETFGFTIGDTEAMSSCSMDDCERPSFCRGWCRSHYGKLKNVGHPCSIDGCDRPKEARGWCKPHYQCWINHGDPLWAPLSHDERFAAYTPDRGDGCWVWQGPRGPFGYGYFADTSAHRWSYNRFNGPIPPGKVVRHRCDNPPCVNPAHLEIGTRRDNSRDMVERDRASRSERHYRSRYSDALVAEARARYAAGEKRSEIASALGIHNRYIYDLLKRKYRRIA